MHPGEYNVYKFIKRGRGGMSRNAYLADLRIQLKMCLRAAGSSSATQNAKDGGGGVLTRVLVMLRLGGRCERQREE
jgi:hypothetical protein